MTHTTLSSQRHSTATVLDGCEPNRSRFRNPCVPPPDEVYPVNGPAIKYRYLEYLYVRCVFNFIFRIQFELNDEIDVEWRKEIIKAGTECDPVWLDGNHPFAILPGMEPSLSLRTVTTKQLLIAAQELGSLVTTDCLSLPHPQTSLGLVGCVAVWLSGKTLSTVLRDENMDKKVEVSKAAHNLQIHHACPHFHQPKFEAQIIDSSKCELPDIGALVVPTLTRIITTPGNRRNIAGMFPNVEILEWDVERFLQQDV
ncbi:hypothetical protein OSTOST_25952 [Ostertagia ostertagi]